MTTNDPRDGYGQPPEGEHREPNRPADRPSAVDAALNGDGPDVLRTERTSADRAQFAPEQGERAAGQRTPQQQGRPGPTGRLADAAGRAAGAADRIIDMADPTSGAQSGGVDSEMMHAATKAFSALRRPGAGPVPRGSGEAAQDSDTASAPGLGHGERPHGQHRQDPATRTDRRDRDR
jgi:hypothetical protein